MLKVEVILGIIASSIAILAFLARAIANIRKGRRERLQQETPERRQIPRGE